MLSPWDESYKRTKAIKTGAAELHSPFSEMVPWMNEFYRDIGAINAWVDASDRVRTRPALRIAFERDEALARFKVGANFNRVEQQRVVAHFVKLLGQLRVRDIEIDRLFATFHSFESCARWEANSAVTDEDLLHLAISLGDLHVWKAYREFASAVFFFDTDEHLRASKTNGARDVCARRYASITDRYDEFGYLRERPIEVEFYSKQSFDRNFHGNWFFFSRRGSLSFDREDPETWGEVRRNASCPCGSGKRFKHCHGKEASA